MSQGFPPRQPPRQSPRASSGQTSPRSPKPGQTSNTAGNNPGNSAGNNPGNSAGNNAANTATGHARGSSTKADTSTAKILENGFTQTESMLLREAIGLAGMRWFDGPGLVMARKEQFELTFRAGESAAIRWVVMSFPLYNMNDANSVEICLHFLAEAHAMVHVLDFQYQVGINMETENLEFLMQLPLQGLSGAQMATLISSFFDALSRSVMEELTAILEDIQK